MTAVGGVAVNDMSDRTAMGLPEHFVRRSLGDVVDRHPEFHRADDLERRLAAGSRLSIEGDPRIDPLAPRMVTLPGATAMIGTPVELVDAVTREWSAVGVVEAWIEKETPRHERRVQSFAIGVTPVTNVEYRAFLEATNHARLPTSWHLGVYPWHSSNHPVHGISAEDADAYAAWLADATGRSFRLPTEVEWEYAASGGDGRQYPWGERFDDRMANTVEAGPLGTSPVGAYLDGASPFGVLDLGGNVEEWVADCYAPYPGAAVVDDDLSGVAPYRVARGGSFARYGDLARCARRHGYFPRPIYALGFRLAESVMADV